jgi:putative membrane protein insertion efficiency factor
MWKGSSGGDSSAWRAGEAGLLARALLLGIEAYRVTLAPLLGGQCRYLPSCSRYAAEAIARHGALRGARLAAARLIRCHPFHPGGFDPVP